MGARKKPAKGKPRKAAAKRDTIYRGCGPLNLLGPRVPAVKAGPNGQPPDVALDRELDGL